MIVTDWLSFWLWLKQKFKDLPLNNFWNCLTEEYLNVHKPLVRVLLPCATAYLWETGFWHYAARKGMYRTRLDAADDIRIQLSSIVPNIKTNLWWKKAEKINLINPSVWSAKCCSPNINTTCLGVLRSAHTGIQKLIQLSLKNLGRKQNPAA